MVEYPEDYVELTGYLNNLSSHTWKSILKRKKSGGNKQVMLYLRRECMPDLRLWSDEELLKYLNEANLVIDFKAISDRL